MSIGSRLKEIRIYLNLSQNEIAKRLKTASKTYWNYENDKREISQDVLYILAQTYKIDLNWLITGSGKMLDNQNNLLLHPCKNDETHKNTLFEEKIKDFKNFSSRLQEVMAANKMTISKFENVTGIPYKRLIKFIADNTMPSLNELILISSLFNVTMDWLVCGNHGS